MVISIANISSKKPPPRYINHHTHSGVVCGGKEGSDVGSSIDPDGNGNKAGGAGADDGGGGADTELSAPGCDSVVKAPTALQALAVLELTALTFQ